MNGLSGLAEKRKIAASEKFRAKWKFRARGKFALAIVRRNASEFCAKKTPRGKSAARIKIGNISRLFAKS